MRAESLTVWWQNDSYGKLFRIEFRVGSTLVWLERAQRSRFTGTKGGMWFGRYSERFVKELSKRGSTLTNQRERGLLTKNRSDTLESVPYLLPDVSSTHSPAISPKLHLPSPWYNPQGLIFGLEEFLSQPSICSTNGECLQVPWYNPQGMILGLAGLPCQPPTCSPMRSPPHASHELASSLCRHYIETHLDSLKSSYNMTFNPTLILYILSIALVHLL